MPDLHYRHSVLNTETSKLTWPLDDQTCKHREYALQEATDRLPEIVDELKRRPFSEVKLTGVVMTPIVPLPLPPSIGAVHFGTMANARIEAAIWLKPLPEGKAPFEREVLYVTVVPNVNRERPYTVRAEMNTKEKWTTLMHGRELSFEGTLQFVDDFLAGFEAGKRSL